MKTIQEIVYQWFHDNDIHVHGDKVVALISSLTEVLEGLKEQISSLGIGGNIMTDKGFIEGEILSQAISMIDENIKKIKGEI